MSVESWIEASVLVLAFVVLALAGLVDASLLKRQRLTIRELFEEGANDRRDRGEEQVTELRSAIDVATLLAVLLIGVVVTRVAMRSFELPGVALSVFGVSLVLILVARAIPVALVERFDIAESGPVTRAGTMIGTVVAPFMIIPRIVQMVFGRSESNGSVLRDQDAAGFSAAESPDHTEQPDDRAADIERDEHIMISGILSMEDALAREIMVPRTDVVAVEVSTPVRDVVRIAQEAGHSRIPVFEESIDRVSGIVYAKDLLRFVLDDVGSVTLSDLMRPAVFVPESKRVDDLLRDLRQARVHMAIVVDEYGGTAGVVTIEDIIEEIVGEIQDEYDREVPLYEIGSSGEVIVDGRMGVDELSEILGVSLPETESETLGGFVQRQLGHIPEPGESIRTGNLRIQVERVERRRVRTLTVYPNGEQDPIDASEQGRAG